MVTNLDALIDQIEQWTVDNTEHEIADTVDGWLADLTLIRNEFVWRINDVAELVSDGIEEVEDGE